MKLDNKVLKYIAMIAIAVATAMPVSFGVIEEKKEEKKGENPSIGEIKIEKKERKLPPGGFNKPINSKDIKLFFKGYDSSNAKNDSSNQVEGATSSSIEKINSSGLRSKLSVKRSDRFGNSDFLYGFDMLDQSYSWSKFSWINRFPKDMLENGNSKPDLMICVRREQKIKELMLKDFGALYQWLDLEKKNEVVKEWLLTLVPFRKDLTLCFPLKSKKSFEADFYLIRSTPMYEEGNEKYNFSRDQETNQVKIEDQFGNLISVVMPASEFIKGFKNAEKICLPISWTMLFNLIMDQLDNFKNAKYFDMLEVETFYNFVQKLIAKKKTFNEISLTRHWVKIHQYFNQNTTLMSNHCLNLSRSPGDLDRFIWLALQNFCEQSPSITHFNLAGWVMKASELIGVIKFLPNLKVLAIGIRGYSDNGCSHDENTIGQYSEQDIKAIKNADRKSVV